MQHIKIKEVVETRRPRIIEIQYPPALRTSDMLRHYAH
jgi:hypothetical protein